MIQQQILKKSNVDLVSLANQLSIIYDLPLSVKKSPNQHNDIELILEEIGNTRVLSIVRNYSPRFLDYEQFSVWHYLRNEESITLHYYGSSIDYFKRTFSDLKETENEFLASIKKDYDETLKNTRPTKSLIPLIHYEKRIANDQSTLEEIFNYAALKFKASKSSISFQSE